MHLYVMHKRDILLTLSAFLCSFTLLLFIGLAGPNVTKIDSTQASLIFKENGINESKSYSLLERGPFLLYPPSLSTYSQHLCLYVTFYLKNEDASETFNKDFIVALKIDGIIGSGGKVRILDEDILLGGGRVHHLYCSLKKCRPIQVFHLEFLEYTNYDFEVSFKNLESVHEKYEISDIRFSFQSVNTSFTTLTIWFRFMFLAGAFSVTCWFTHSLHRYPFTEWSLEQKWTAFVLPLLILYDNPFYPMVFLFGSSFPRLMEVLFHTSFYSSLLLFWLVFFHGVRQTNRTFSRFYAPKLVIVGSFFLSISYMSSWSRVSLLEKPTLDEEAAFQDSSLLQISSLLFYSSLVAYAVYLVSLILTAFTELRAMQYFDLRIKLQAFLIFFSVSIAILVVVISVPSIHEEDTGDISHIHALRLLPWMYESSSSASFLTIFSISNLYVFFSAYFYHPSKASLIESRVFRDDPTISMMNDSDEEIIYASSDQPMNQINLIETGDDEEEDSD